MSRLGCTHLAFGAENPDLSLLLRIADLLENPPDPFQAVLKASLSAGKGYPASLAAAAGKILPEAAGILHHPNNILAICYLRAIRKLKLPLSPVLIPRRGSYHAAFIDPLSPSASALRTALLRGSYREAWAALPDISVSILKKRFLAGNVIDDNLLDILLLSRLRSMLPEEAALLPDLSEGLENRLIQVARDVSSRQELLSHLSGKRYAAARISRLCAYALLDLSADQLRNVPLPDTVRLLGLRNSPGMTSLWNHLPLRILPDTETWKNHPAFDADRNAWRIWSLCCRLPDSLPYKQKIIHICE